jgi:hypothetical protein
MDVLDTTANLMLPAWLTGPIFDKELRVASRRKRYYWLRAAFIVLLLFLISAAWSMETSFGSGSAAYVSVRMATVSRGVVNAVVWLEFITPPSQPFNSRWANSLAACCRSPSSSA